MWSWLGLNLGKRAGLVSIVGLLITVTLGLGITRLEFATGQDSYLNKSDQVYKDSVAYQGLFGGQAMLTLVTMDEGRSVNDVLDPAGLKKWESIEKELRDSGLVFGVVTPRNALQFTDALVQSPADKPTESVAAKILLGATAREPTAAGKEARTKASLATLVRLQTIPAERRVLTDPEWVDFLL
ncbi:MAG: uncharacterized protein QOH68_3986, partial [Nocardioidaceae bacterium]|nr:uncharacterized protein [Nocardioidaceae bacterium]